MSFACPHIASTLCLLLLSLLFFIIVVYLQRQKKKITNPTSPYGGYRQCLLVFRYIEIERVVEDY